MIIVAVVLTVFLLPLAIVLPGLRKKWICPACNTSSLKAYCGECGASMRAKPSYAGFQKRFAAMLIDGLLMSLPITILATTEHLGNISRPGWFFLRLTPALIGSIYTLYYTSHFGQTPGKYLAGIRIVTLGLKHIRPQEALKREALNLAWSAFFICVSTIVLANTPEETFRTMTWMERSKLPETILGTGTPLWLSQVWVLSELLILLTNKKCRALHDFIAGTVVVDEKTLKRKLPLKHRFRWWGVS